MPRPFKHEDGDFLIKKETDQGVSVTPDRRLGHIIDSISLPDVDKEHEEQYFVGGDGISADDLRHGVNEYTGGSVTVKPVDELPFELLLGTNLNGGAISLVSEEDEHLSATVQAIYNRSNDPDLVREFKGCVFGSGDITLDGNDDLLLELDFDALEEEVGATKGTASGTTLSEQGFSFADQASNLSVFGAQFSRLNDFTLSIDKNTEVKNYLNSTEPRDPDEILLNNAEITIDATITVSDSAIINELLDGTNQFTTSIGFVNDAGKSLEISASGCKIRSAPHDLVEEGSVDVDVEIVASDVQVGYSEPTN
jgi:hypothetical protein